MDENNPRLVQLVHFILLNVEKFRGYTFDFDIWNWRESF